MPAHPLSALSEGSIALTRVVLRFFLPSLLRGEFFLRKFAYIKDSGGFRVDVEIGLSVHSFSFLRQIFLRGNLAQRGAEDVKVWKENKYYYKLQRERAEAGSPVFVLHDGPVCQKWRHSHWHSVEQGLKEIIVVRCAVWQVSECLTYRGGGYSRTAH